MHPSDSFRFCPACGVAQDGNGSSSADRFECPQCGHVYFFNPAIAAGAVLLDAAGRVLLIRRAKAPAEGMLAVPGGFIDFGETAESAMRREVKEELGVAVTDVEYLCNSPNDYHYKGITYRVLDFFFVARLRGNPTAIDHDREEVSGIVWMDYEAIDPDTIAFPSMREALRAYGVAIGARTS